MQSAHGVWRVQTRVPLERSREMNMDIDKVIAGLKAAGWPLLELGTQVTMLPEEHWEEFRAARAKGRGEEYLDAKAKEVIPRLVRQGHVLGAPGGPHTVAAGDHERACEK